MKEELEVSYYPLCHINAVLLKETFCLKIPVWNRLPETHQRKECLIKNLQFGHNWKNEKK